MTGGMMSVASVSVSYARNGASTKANELGMRPMQERAYAKRGEQYLLIKSPPASGKSRALMFIALDKLHNQGLRQAIIVVPEKSIGAASGSAKKRQPSPGIATRRSSLTTPRGRRMKSVPSKRPS